MLASLGRGNESPGHMAKMAATLVYDKLFKNLVIIS